MSIRKSAIVLVICCSVMLGVFAVFFQVSTSSFKTFNLVSESVRQWSQIQDLATYNVIQYSVSEKDGYYQNFLKDLKKSNTLKAGRSAGLKENYNLNMDGKLMFGERLNAVALREVADYFQQYSQLGPMKKVNDKWDEGDNKLALLGDIASEIHDDVLNHQLVSEKREYYLMRVDRIKKDLRAIQVEAFNALNEAQDNLQLYYQWVSFVVAAFFALLLAGIGFYLFRPVMRDLFELRSDLNAAAVDESPVQFKIKSLDFQFLQEPINKLIYRLQLEEKARERAQTLAGLGSWKWEGHLRKMTWSKKVFDILNLPVGMGASYEAFRDRVHLEDRALFDKLLRPETFEELNELPVEIRIVCNVKGRWELRHCSLLVSAEPSGDLTVISGTIQDVSDRHKAKAS